MEKVSSETRNGGSALLYDELELRAPAARTALGGRSSSTTARTDGSFAALARLHAQQRRTSASSACAATSARRPPSHAGFAEAGGDVVVTIDARPPGRSRRDPAAAREARRGLRPRQRLEDAGAATRGRGASPRASSTVSPAGCPAFASTTSTAGSRRTARRSCEELALYGELHRFIPVLAATGLPRRRARRSTTGRASTAARVRPRALPARLPRPAHGPVHRPLPPPPAAPVRRRSGSCSAWSGPAILALPDGPQAAGRARSARGRCCCSASCWSSSGVQFLSLGLSAS